MYRSFRFTYIFNSINNYINIIKYYIPSSLQLTCRLVPRIDPYFVLTKTSS